MWQKNCPENTREMAHSSQNLPTLAEKAGLSSYLVRIRVYLFPRQVAQEADHRGNRYPDEGSQLGPIATQNSEHVNLDVDVPVFDSNNKRYRVAKGEQ